MSAPVRATASTLGIAWRRGPRNGPFLAVRVNRGPGIVTYLGSEVYSVMAFTLTGGKIAEIHVLADPARLKRLALPQLRD